MQLSLPPASRRSQERFASVRVSRFLPILALSGFAACGGSSSGGGQSGIPGEFLEKPSGDGVLTIRVNMHEAFRWQDVATGENQPGVWDIAPPLYEPVVQFGANQFDVTLETR